MRWVSELVISRKGQVRISPLAMRPPPPPPPRPSSPTTVSLERKKHAHHTPQAHTTFDKTMCIAYTQNRTEERGTTHLRFNLLNSICLGMQFTNPPLTIRSATQSYNGR